MFLATYFWVIFIIFSLFVVVVVVRVCVCVCVCVGRPAFDGLSPFW